MIEPTAAATAQIAERHTIRRERSVLPVIVDRGERAEVALLPSAVVRAGHCFSLRDARFEIVGRRPHCNTWVAVPAGH